MAAKKGQLLLHRSGSQADVRLPNIVNMPLFIKIVGLRYLYRSKLDEVRSDRGMPRELLISFMSVPHTQRKLTIAIHSVFEGKGCVFSCNACYTFIPIWTTIESNCEHITLILHNIFIETVNYDILLLLFMRRFFFSSFLLCKPNSIWTLGIYAVFNALFANFVNVMNCIKENIVRNPPYYPLLFIE